METMRASHAFEDHTSEVRVHLEAPSLRELFVEAGRALAELMSDEAAASDGAFETVELTANDREALLVAWLNELVFRSETAHKVFTELRIDCIDDRSLSAEIAGHAPRDARTPVKAATYHGLHLAERAGTFTATVILDV